MKKTTDLARGVVIAGISGTDFDSTTAPFGGYVLFPQDASIEEVRTLTDALRASGNPPPVIAIDQEGGRVMRLRAGVEPMPPMMALGAADDVDLVQRAAEQLAFDLRRAGCTLDFAPVLDLALEPQNVVIGTRSFGSDPRRVAQLATFGRGLEAAGILPCYKHFPGHGATAVDSHEALPRIELDASTLRSRDLFPFAEVAANAPAIMSAHVIVTTLDAQHPATFSHRIASQLLRDELGFNGALVTDCLEMQAAVGRGAQRGVEALAAGADLLLFSHDLEAANATVDAIVLAVEAGRIPMSRLEEAHARAVALRSAAAPPLPLDAIAPHPMVGREIARRAITLVRGLPHADPVASAAVSFGATKRALEREAPALEELLVAADPPPSETARLLEILAARGRRPLLLARRAHLHPLQAGAIAQIIDRFPDALVVSLGEPFDVTLFDGARHVVAAYGDDDVSIGGLADVIFGSSMPTGRLPISNASS